MSSMRRAFFTLTYDANETMVFVVFQIVRLDRATVFLCEKSFLLAAKLVVHVRKDRANDKVTKKFVGCANDERK